MSNFPSSRAASASFSTSGGGSITTGQTVSVSINANSSDAYNAVSVSVSFSGLTYAGSSGGTGWTPVAGPSVSGNTVSFSGALLGSSATGSRNVLKVTLKAGNNPGTGTVSASGSIALANGSGTQVNGSGNTVTYTIKTPPSPTPTPKAVAGAVSISSSSHPSQTAWYKEKDAVLNWKKDEGVVGFSYSVDQNSGTTPDDSIDSSNTTYTATNLPDGKNFFHIKAKNDVGWGSTGHYQLNIDTTVPDPFTPTYVKEERKLYFSTNDSGGISKYEVKVDGQDMGSQVSGFLIASEPQTIEVIAYDNAGNVQSGSVGLSRNDSTPQGSGLFSDLTSANASNSKGGLLSRDKSKTVLQQYGILIFISLLTIALAVFVFVYPKWRKRRNLH